MSEQQQPTRIWPQLIVLTLARLFVKTGIRMVYPFVPALGRGVGVETARIYNLVAIRSFAGFLSPLFGPLSERLGRKPVMIGSIILFSLSCFLVVVWPNYWFLGITLSLIAIAQVIYDPAMQAHFGDTVPYQKRGRVIAITELSWAGSLLIGAPLVGFAIAKQGWQAPFVWLGLAGLVSAVLVMRILPGGQKGQGENGRFREIGRVWQQHPVIWAAAGYSLCIMMANETFFIVYGDWMEGSFNLSLTNLGLAAGVIGGSEIVGELFAGFSVDRFGKRPVVLTAGILCAAIYGIIPFVGGGLTGALLALVVLFLSFEVTVVGGIPLLTEVVPSARGVVMSAVIAGTSLGRALGALLGPLVWNAGGLIGNGVAAMLIMFVGVGVLARWIREGKEI